MMVTKDPPIQPARWRPKSRAHPMAMGEDVHSRARATDFQRADTADGRLEIFSSDQAEPEEAAGRPKVGLGPPRGESRAQEGQITAKL